MNDRQAQSGPLKFPLAPPSAEAARAVESLRGHTTSDLWLVEGLWPELDAIRAEHLRVRSQVAAGLDALSEVDARFRQEDARHDRNLLQAQRDGNPALAEDHRTPPEQRQAERKAIEERIWAGAIVLAEVADAVVDLAREREDAWLADLRQRLEPAQEKRRQLESLLAEAKADEWQVHQLGMWLQKLSDEGPVGRQPAPTPSPPPAQFSEELLRTSLERPWHQRREAEELPRSWQERSEEAAEELPGEETDDPVDPPAPEPGGDVTGTVYPLDESVSGAASA
jgi:hypothetical protein